MTAVTHVSIFFAPSARRKKKQKAFPFIEYNSTAGKATYDSRNY